MLPHLFKKASRGPSAHPPEATRMRHSPQILRVLAAGDEQLISSTDHQSSGAVSSLRRPEQTPRDAPSQHVAVSGEVTFSATTAEGEGEGEGEGGATSEWCPPAVAKHTCQSPKEPDASHPPEWQVQTDNLGRQFPGASKEMVVAALRKHEGHAGRAAYELPSAPQVTVSASEADASRPGNDRPHDSDKESPQPPAVGSSDQADDNKQHSRRAETHGGEESGNTHAAELAKTPERAANTSVTRGSIGSASPTPTLQVRTNFWGPGQCTVCVCTARALQLSPARSSVRLSATGAVELSADVGSHQ